ncbi:MAG: hypothetical protein AB7T49_08040 [Oligoflexales bacterium]
MRLFFVFLVCLFSLEALADVDGSLRKIDEGLEQLDSDVGEQSFTRAQAETYLKRLEQSSSSLTSSMNAIAKKTGVPLRSVTAHFWEAPWQDEPKSWQEVQEDNWFFLGPTYWGYLSHNAGFKQKFGMEAGLSFPWLRGIDLSVNWGSLFDDDRDYAMGYSLMLYLTRYKAGWYIGGTNVKDHPSDGFGFFGYQFDQFYVKVDMIRGQRPAFSPILAYGYKLRF